MGSDVFFVSLLNWNFFWVILVFLSHHLSKSAILCYPTVIHKGINVMSLFNTVHILQVVIIENMEMLTHMLLVKNPHTY